MPSFTYYPAAALEFDTSALCMFDDLAACELLEAESIAFEFDPWLISFSPGETGTLVNEDTGEVLFDETTLETLIAEPAT